jgi:hypothetical protein
VTYRDETETLRAQVEKLEGELASANQQVARLRGEAPGSAAGTAGPDKLVGEPLVFDEEHVLPYRLTEQGYEAIAALLKERLAVDVAQVGSTLKGTVRAGVGPTFSLTCEGETTRVKLRTDLTMLRASTLSGAWLGGLFGGLPAIGIIMDLAHNGIGSPLHALWVVPTLLLGAGLGMRKFTAKRAREGRAKHSGTFAALLDVAAQHRLGATDGSRVRVEVAAESDTAAESAEREHEVPVEEARAGTDHVTSSDPSSSLS